MTATNASTTGATLVPTDPYRPGYHFTPERNWMNDPNGLVWHEGEYHLFFQHNPEGTGWGNMSWGHAVSRDLRSWEELPVALRSTPAEHAFSGSVVVDHDNTSGLGEPGRPAMVALYTGHDPTTGVQRQCVAFSLDRGRTWSRYHRNPVLDLDSTEFRDPKVFWYGDGGYWVMLVAMAEERLVLLYRSTDLLTWERLGDFGPAGSVDGVWECPDLFQLPVEGEPGASRWVMVVSVQTGAPAGGSGTQYFVGDFDGTVFTADPVTSGETTWVDHGADHYAAVSFSGLPDHERTAIGWMSNWAYAHEVPARLFRGSMSVPRRYTLATVDGRVRLRQQPLIGALPAPAYVAGPLPVAEGVHPLPTGGARLRVVAELEPGTADRVGLQVRVGQEERTVVAYDASSSEVLVDRTRSGEDGFSAGFPAVHRAPVAPGDGAVRLEVLVDTTSVEAFVGDGDVVLSDQVFPSAGSTGLAVFAEGGDATVRRIEVTRVDADQTRAELPDDVSQNSGDLAGEGMSV
jgi:sucrose-6-phosphate hydrolase SacC (GH32 family)